MTQADTTRSAGEVQDLAKEVATLQHELATLRREIDTVRRARPPVAPQPSPEALRRQQQAWDMVLGLNPEVRQRPAQQAPRRRTFEDVGVRFLMDHAGKVWLLLLVLAVLAVTFRDRLA